MLRKEIILKTAVCYWSTDDDCYIVESPLFPAVIAAEKTPNKTFKLYKNMLDSTYTKLLKDNVHGFKRGRPAKDGVELHVQVQSDTKHLIDELRKEIGISQGEFIDLIALYYAKKAQSMPVKTDLSLETTISELFDALQTQGFSVTRKQKLQKAVG